MADDWSCANFAAFEYETLCGSLVEVTLIGNSLSYLFLVSRLI